MPCKNRGTTTAELRCSRVSIYDQIRELMLSRSSGNIERFCRLAGVSRAGFYRHRKSSRIRKKWSCDTRFKLSSSSIAGTTGA